jgi:hypothetical protein
MPKDKSLFGFAKETLVLTIGSLLRSGDPANGPKRQAKDVREMTGAATNQIQSNETTINGVTLDEPPTSRPF